MRCYPENARVSTVSPNPTYKSPQVLREADDFDPELDEFGELLEAGDIVLEVPGELELAPEVAVVPAPDGDTVEDEDEEVPLLDEDWTSGVKCDTVPSGAW